MYSTCLPAVPAGGLAAEAVARGAAPGGVAVLRCRVPGAGAVRDAAWYRAGTALNSAAGQGRRHEISQPTLHFSMQCWFLQFLLSALDDHRLPWMFE